MLATMFRFNSVAPLDSPVVPPVYCRKATSSRVLATGPSASLPPAATASLKRTEFGSDHSGTISSRDARRY